MNKSKRLYRSRTLSILKCFLPFQCSQSPKIAKIVIFHNKKTKNLLSKHSTLHRLHALHVCSLENCTDCTQNDQNFHFNLAKWPITMNYHRFRSLFRSLFSLNSRITMLVSFSKRICSQSTQCSW